MRRRAPGYTSWNDIQTPRRNRKSPLRTSFPSLWIPDASPNSPCRHPNTSFVHSARKRGAFVPTRYRIQLALRRDRNSRRRGSFVSFRTPGTPSQSFQAPSTCLRTLSAATFPSTLTACSSPTMVTRVLLRPTTCAARILSRFLRDPVFLGGIESNTDNSDSSLLEWT